MRLLFALLALTVSAAAWAAPALGEVVLVDDGEGRSIRFEVESSDVDVEWYADLMRKSAHGDEIESVTIRLVPYGELASSCGAAAAGCYGGPRSRSLITIPAARNAETAHTLIHEYGHHVDRSHDVSGVREPNGTQSWWTARRIADLLAAGEVARDYSLGWERSISEIFAEDYAQLHLKAPYRIDWLQPPGGKVRQALQADLEGEPDSPVPPPAGEPLVIVRSGRLGPGERRTLPFTLLGPGRRVVFSARVDGVGSRGVRARAELVCGTKLETKGLGTGVRNLIIRRADLGPAICEVVLANTGATSRRYTVRLRLSVEA
jgi:hypothetical protein